LSLTRSLGLQDLRILKFGPKARLVCLKVAGEVLGRRKWLVIVVDSRFSLQRGLVHFAVDR